MGTDYRDYDGNYKRFVYEWPECLLHGIEYDPQEGCYMCAEAEEWDEYTFDDESDDFI